MENAFARFLVERDLVPPQVARRLSEGWHSEREPLGMIALAHGLLRPEQIDEILDVQRERPRLFGEIAVELGYLSQDRVNRLLKIQAFRVAVNLGEVLTLSGIISCEDMARYLGAYLLHDRELASILADD